MSTTAKIVEKTTLLSINPTIYFCGYGTLLTGVGAEHMPAVTAMARRLDPFQLMKTAL
jgi:hypothetical protein